MNELNTLISHEDFSYEHLKNALSSEGLLNPQRMSNGALVAVGHSTKLIQMFLLPEAHAIQFGAPLILKAGGSYPDLYNLVNQLNANLIFGKLSFTEENVVLASNSVSFLGGITPKQASLSFFEFDRSVKSVIELLSEEEYLDADYNSDIGFDPIEYERLEQSKKNIISAQE